MNISSSFIERPIATSLLMAAIAFYSSLTLRVLTAEPEVSEKDLPRVPPTEPSKALATFQIKRGFQIELVAAFPRGIGVVIAKHLDL